MSVISNPLETNHTASPTSAEVIQLRRLSESLAKLRDEFYTLDSREKANRDFLENSQEKIAADFDSPRDEILDSFVAERRRQIAFEFLNGLPARRELLTRQLIGQFANLNHALEPLSRQEFFVNGMRPSDCITPALAAIDALLKP